MYRFNSGAFKDVMFSNDVKTRTNFLHLLSHLLLREGRRSTLGKESHNKLAQLLDTSSNLTSDEEKIVPVAQDSEKNPKLEGNGAELCDILQKAYDDENGSKDAGCLEERSFLVLAFRNLLCISFQAKDAAVEGSFSP